MIIEINIPTPGESITEVELANWLVDDGAIVSKNQEVAEVESDKATLPLIAEQAGKIKILIEAGSTIAVGTVACTIDTSVGGKVEGKSKVKVENEGVKNVEKVKEETGVAKKVKATPLAKKMMDEEGLNIDDIINGLKKISASDVKQVLQNKHLPMEATGDKEISREIKSEPMSQLRKKLSTRLVTVKNETAMLTTFNEVDMSAAIALRKKYQKQFTDKHNVKLGYMSLFTKAASIALKAFPKINSYIDGASIVSPNYVDVAIAVQTDKGLMVPVVRNTDVISIADIEKEIAALAQKARSFKLSIDEMSGGTFTITNGGVFGSMLSTPILNPPQSGILGMHNIVERPVAINGKVEVRPIMYVALSYDHRIVDGRDSVSFLVKLKELLEAPFKMLLGSIDQDKALLDI